MTGDAELHPTRGVATAPRPPVPDLPLWPIGAAFVLYPLWWVTGLLDFILVPLGIIMLGYLVQFPGARAPRSFVLWLAFLVWAAASVVMLEYAAQLLNYGFRVAAYASATIVFVYIYNVRSQVTGQYVLGCLTAVWVTTVAGGFLGVLFPEALLRTPMSYLMPGGLLSNDLVNHMVIRRMSQYNPSEWFDISPRPSAPYRYTNNWGNAYSILLPAVIAYLVSVRGTRRFWLLLVLLPISLVPALLTLNRGMMLGVAVGLAYASLRQLLRGRPRLMVMAIGAALVAAVAFTLLPVEERIEGRLENSSSSNETRVSLYSQALALTAEAPILGYGVPVSGDNPNAPPVGTQGQFWVSLVSHGVPGAALFVGWFAFVVWQSRHRRDLAAFTSHVALLVATMELAYYGVVPYGLPWMMAYAALALRPRAIETPPGDRV